MDTISRQQAIDALCWLECGRNNAECMYNGGTDFCVTCDNVKELKSLPSAQPEHKTGHWIPVTNGRGGHKCDRCGCYAPSYQSGAE